MSNYTLKVEQLYNELQASLPIKPEHKQRLDKKMRLEFNYNSNHIEGNTLTYDETELLLIFDKTTGNHEYREYEEMQSHDVAYSLVQEWAAESEWFLTEAAIKNLNKIILVKPFWKEAQTPDGQTTRRLIKIGNYKEQPNSVRLPNGEMFEYASPAETPIQMGELLQWFKDEEAKAELHPVTLAALLHYRFVRIHPFVDGNGRISRLLMNYVLLKNDLPPVIIKSAEKKAYLFALNQADTGNLSAFVEYIEQQLIWSLNLFVKAAKGESLEEGEDIYKEIAVWKKSLSSVKDTFSKNNELIIDRYYDSIKPFFVKYKEKYKEIFGDLFHEYYDYIGFNNKESNIESIEEFFQTLIGTSNNNQKGQTEFKHFLFRITFKYFKKAGEKVFDLDVVLVCMFNKYNWTVGRSDRKKRTLTKLYIEPLADNEIDDFINQSVRDDFEFIQQEFDRGKE